MSTQPTALAQLRHLYQNMLNGGVRDTASAKRIAEGLLGPAIAALERGTPATGGEPAVSRNAVLDLIDDCPGLMLEQDHWLSRRVKELEPTSPQPVREPLTLEQMDAALGSAKKVKPGYVGWVTDQRREWGRAVERAHGIKGGQHDTDAQSN